MTIANDLAQKLSFGLPDRLAKALYVSGVTSIEMAEYLGVSRTTISNYTNGRTPLKKQTLRLWALRCGVPLGWLETGMLEVDSDNGPDGGGNVTDSESGVTWLYRNSPDVVPIAAYLTAVSAPTWDDEIAA